MAEKPNQLERGLGLAEATALNMMDMVGIGPFIVMPLVIQRMGGPQCLLAWIAGALMALLDGCVWAELGAAMPEAGGSYVFLREEYDAHWGRLMSFLFVWQTMIQAPLVIASGAIGFAQYFSYLVPLHWWQQKAISAGLIVFLVALLYQGITRIGRLSLFLWAGVIGTLLWIILAGATHFHAALAFDFPPGAWNLSLPFSQLWEQLPANPSIPIGAITTYAIWAEKFASRKTIFRAQFSFQLSASPFSTSPCRSA